MNQSNPEVRAFGQKGVWFEDLKIPCGLYHREELPEGARFNGPALIFQYDTTTVIPPHWQAEVDFLGNVVLTIRP